MDLSKTKKKVTFFGNENLTIGFFKLEFFFFGIENLTIRFLLVGRDSI